MATENQNFFKHFRDTFSIIFTVTDVTETLDNYIAQWNCSTSPSSSILVSKNTDPEFTGGGTDGDITIVNQTISVQLSQDDFIDPDNTGVTNKLYTGSFYHELVIGSSGQEDGSDSVVIASGIFTVKEDLASAVRPN
jgi:hypothetical protein